MLKRKIQEKIVGYFQSESNKILIINGARQIGKSFVIRFEGRRHFKNYIEIDLIEDKLGPQIFAGIKNKEDFYLRLSSIAGDRMKNKRDTLVFLDEIQAYPELLTLLKFLKDDDRFTYIVSGSQLGIALNRTLSKPGGRIDVVKMFPLDFEEFLWANGVGEEFIDHVRNCFRRRETPDIPIHDRMMDLFKKYLLVGGLPDAVNTFIQTRNIVEGREVHKEIHNLYKEDAAQYDREHKLVIHSVYGLVPSNLENKKKRVVFSKIEAGKHARADRYMQEFEYLVQSGICNEVRAVSNPKFPLVESEGKNLLKLYMNDPGLLTNLLYRYNVSAVMDDIKSINLGSVYEQMVSCELAAHGFSLFYYDNKKKGEVDFLLDDYDSLSIMPVEVKSGKDYTKHLSLDHFMNNPEYGIRHAVVLSNEREVKENGKIIYLPVYCVMFLEPSAVPDRVVL